MTDESLITTILRIKSDHPDWGYINIGKEIEVHKDKVRRAVEHYERKNSALPTITSPAGAVSLYDAACAALDAAVRVDEIKSVLDVRVAISAYARQAKNYDLEAKAAVLRERAERKLGEKLIQAKKAGQLAEGRPPKTVDPQRQFPRVTLDEAEISRDLSSRAQKKAGIAEQAFEAMVERMREGIASGKRVPDALKAHQPINGSRAIAASRAEPDDSLDYFPTCPWATRALMDVVLPHLNLDLTRSRIWEPACGEGHISEVLREYSSHVCATDIHDYGNQAGVHDFLEGDCPTGDMVGWNADWIITNPPFGDKAVAFVIRALAETDFGVAMFFRSQWAVEGIERYEKIFRDNPPTLCAFFVERVNLCKGKWDPDGSTLTAYCWLIWVKGMAPQPPFWIPPGCRERFTKPDDRRRFAAWSIDELSDHDPITGEVVEAAQ